MRLKPPLHWVRTNALARYRLMRIERLRSLRIQPPLPELTITAHQYKLYPSPRNQHREIFEHEVFVPHMYALVDPPSYDPQGKWNLFAAHRLADGKNGQLVTFELEGDARRFRKRFVAD